MTTRVLSATLLAFSLTCSGSVAWAGFPKGTLVIVEKPIDTSSPTFEKDLKKAQKDTFAKDGEVWKLFLVAYLKKAAGSVEVNLVFYELSGKTRGEQVNAFPIATKPKAEILASTIEISPEQGFKAGKRYEVLITRLVGGKEDVYARTIISLN